MKWLCKLNIHKYDYIVLDDARVKCVCKRCGHGFVWKPGRSIIEQLKRRKNAAK